MTTVNWLCVHYLTLLSLIWKTGTIQPINQVKNSTMNSVAWNTSKGTTNENFFPSRHSTQCLEPNQPPGAMLMFWPVKYGSSSPVPAVSVLAVQLLVPKRMLSIFRGNASTKLGLNRCLESNWTLRSFPLFPRANWFRLPNWLSWLLPECHVAQHLPQYTKQKLQCASLRKKTLLALLSRPQPC